MRRGCGSCNGESVLDKSLREPTLENDLIECLVQSLGGSGIFRPLIELARRFGKVNFIGSIDLPDALSWLVSMKNILDEGMKCLDKDKVWIMGFMLKGDANGGWLTERFRMHPIWNQFKETFNAKYYPSAYQNGKRNEFERLTQESMTVVNPRKYDSVRV